MTYLVPSTLGCQRTNVSHDENPGTGAIGETRIDPNIAGKLEIVDARGNDKVAFSTLLQVESVALIHPGTATARHLENNKHLN